MLQFGAAWKLATRSPSLIILGWFLLIGIVLALWWSSRHTRYDEERELALQGARQMAQQMVSTAAAQSKALLRLLDFTTRAMGEAWAEGGAPGLASAIRRMNAGIPGDAWLGARVINSQGQVLYEIERVPLITSQAVEPATLLTTHRQHQEPALHIGAPVRFPHEERWALPLSFPLSTGPRERGVIEMFVNPDFLGRALHATFPNPQDLALILDASGLQLAHSLDPALAIPDAQVPDLPLAQQSSGVTTSFTASEHAPSRLYAWKQVDETPLYAVVGLSRHYTMDPAEAAITANRRANLMGTLAVLAAAICLATLFWQRRRAWIEQQTHNERLALALRGADLGWWDLDFHQKKLHFNTQWALTLGYQPSELPNTPDGYLEWLHPDDQHTMRQAFVAHLRRQTPRFQAEYRVRHHHGHWIWVLDRGQVLLRDSQGRAIRAAGTLLDISARKRAEATLTAEARTDPLTGLANRRALLDHLEQQAHCPRPSTQSDILMLIDIDHFKQVNDKLGHAAGDRALQHLAHLLRTNLRQPDFAARLGGEEFAVLAPGIGSEAGLRLAERLRACVAASEVATVPGLRFTVSIGLALFNPMAIEESMHQADQAMYSAKHAGRDRVRLWEEEQLMAG